MTDNRTTELREKLDALGVEHYDTEYMTEWHDVRGLKWNYFSDGENTDLTLETPWEGCTPGQAVAALLPGMRREGRGQMTRLLFFIAGGVFGIMALALLIASDDQ